jgi:hypothetical protein
VWVVCWVHVAKGTCKCGGVGSARDELHGALKNTRQLGPCRCLWNTKLYKSGRWGQEHVGFALLRLCATSVKWDGCVQSVQSGQ